MQVYFSHSYRDVPINAYFTGLFDQAGISLRADQKSDVWCMAKLEGISSRWTDSCRSSPGA